MRCVECESEPLSPARYCECCGRELLLHRTQIEETHPINGQAEETPCVSGQTDPIDAQAEGDQQGEMDAVSGPDDWAAAPSLAWDLRCPDCGGLRLDGDRCQVCEEDSAIEPTDAAMPASNEPAPSATPANLEPPQALPEAAMTRVNDQVPAAGAKTVETEAKKTQEAQPKRAKAAANGEKVRRPAVVTRRPYVPAAPQRPRRPIVLAAVAVVLAAIAIGAPWLRIHEPSVIVGEQHPTPLVAQARPTEIADVGEHATRRERPTAPATATQDRKAALPSERPATQIAATQDRKATTTVTPKASVPNQPKPVTPARPTRRAAVPAVVNKPVRVEDSPREIPTAPVLASAPLIAPPLVDVVATAPTPATPPAAVGPFFDTKDVNEAPRVASRAEPRVPDELRGRAIKEMVVVRALVSQSGHPTRISLLRRTKTGPQLDDVVVAAVNQWTFSPARKKGEAVSCWFNFAVQVGGVE